MVLTEEDLHVQVMGWGQARCRGGGGAGRSAQAPPRGPSGVCAGHPQVRARGATGQESVQPEGPELVEKEADLQVTLPRGVSVTRARGGCAGLVYVCQPFVV